MKDEKDPSRLPGLNAWAEWERHFEEADEMIAERLKLNLPLIRQQRETCFLYWEYLERKAKAMPPARDTTVFAPGEFLRWSERQPHPAGSRWGWLGWGLILLVAIIFFVQRIPGLHDGFAGFIKAVFPCL